MNAKNNITVVAFFGIDGSGKTTLANLLANILKKMSTKVYIVRLRAHHTLMYILIRLFFWGKNYDFKTLQGKPLHSNYIIKQYFGNKGLYVVLEIAGVLIWLMMKILPRLILWKKRVIFIADRFIPDFIVMLSFTSNCEEHRLLKLAKFLEKIMHAKIIYFHVYVDPCVAVVRKREEQLYPQFTMYMALKYQWISKYLECITIDTTNRGPHELVTQIFEILKQQRIIKT